MQKSGRYLQSLAALTLVSGLSYLAATHIQTTGAARAATEGTTSPRAATDAAYLPLPKGTITFNKQIAPIIYENCSSCHHQGEVAPFNLMNYTDAQKRAQQIALVTADRTMPPWKADAGHEMFTDARLLTPQQIGMIQQWVSEGSLAGRAVDLPAAPRFASSWSLGEPDAVLDAGAAYNLAAEGTDVYRCFVIPTNYPEDRWVSAMAVRPGNRKIVHHTIAYLDVSGKARQLDAADLGPGYTSSGGGVGFNPTEGALGGWAPGNEARRTPDGVGIFLPKGADIVLQVHYHKSGKPETDLTKIGLYFCKTPVDKRLRVMPIVHWPLNIPAGDANYQVYAGITTPAPVTLDAVMPHMHLLGHDMAVTATLPDGTVKKLVHVPDWDFNWQTTYTFNDPIKLPAGSKVELTASYDNSAKNLVNPSTPPRPVKWGEQTTDEMCIAFAYYTVDAEQLTKGIKAQGFPNGYGAGGSGLNRQALTSLLKMFDKNGDGKLDDAERAEAAKYVRGLLAGKKQ